MRFFFLSLSHSLLEIFREQYKYIEREREGEGEKKLGERKDKVHAISIINFFLYVELLLERLRKGKKKEKKKKNRNQRVSLSRSSFRSTNALYSRSCLCWGALVRLRSPPSSLEFNFIFSFSLSYSRPLETGFFSFCDVLSPDNFLYHSIELIVVIVNR